jgi:hypothetical protein
MPYLALVDEQEVEFADLQAVAEALRDRQLLPETWIKDANVEADWETVEDMLPHLCRELGL